MSLAQMQLPPDYHMHTALCRHALGKAVDYAAQAQKIGLKEIGFAEHSPMARDDFDDWRMPLHQLEDYVAQVQLAREQFPSLSIKLGLEIDYLPGQEDWIRNLVERYSWDYLIGSVHYVADGWAVDNPNQISNWRGRDPDWVWRTYFERLTMAVETGFFDIIGHADLPKKFGIYPRQEFTPVFKNFLQKAQVAGVALELNTGGLRKQCQEIYPSAQFLSLMHQHQVPIIFGSDAHAPAEVGFEFQQAVALAQKTGYTHYCRFQQRRRELVPF